MQRSFCCVAALAVLLAAVAQGRSAEAPESQGATVAANMQRTNWAPACPKPPYQFRWLWVNGERIDPAKVKPLTPNRADWAKGDPRPADLLPAIVTVRFNAYCQPVAARGLALIGSEDGDLFAIDLASGETVWRKKASGPILHTVTVADGVVFAATTRGVDAFELDGTKRWTFRRPRASFWACPAVAGGKVLVGGLDGVFYALDAKTGEPVWTYTAGAQILHSPAVYENSVYFGAENMHAYSLDLGTGKLNWENDKTYGFSFDHYWPVVAAKAGVVLFRTNSLAGIGPGYETVERAPHDYVKSQEALRDYFAKHPEERNLYALDLKTGKEKVQVETGHFCAGGTITPLPIVRPNGEVWCENYAREGAFLAHNEFKFWGHCVDVGRINFETGFFERPAPAGSRAMDLDLTRADSPTAHIFGGGPFLFFYHYRHGLCGENLEAKDPRWVLSAYRDNRGRPGMTDSPGWVEPTITPDLILINNDSAMLLAIESKAE